MKHVFADTLYWVGLIRPGDPWQKAALKANERYKPFNIITTTEVLIEALNTLSEPEFLRQRAISMIRTLLRKPGVTVVPPSQQSFEEGADLYEKRPDKKYSLTDCISMNTMRAYGLTDVLTNDADFTKEGFNILLKDED